MTDINALADWLGQYAGSPSYQKAAKALRRLAALEAGGMVMVPAKPTQTMLDAAYKTYPDPSNAATAMLEIYYTVMLAARPQGGSK